MRQNGEYNEMHDYLPFPTNWDPWPRIKFEMIWVDRAIIFDLTKNYMINLVVWGLVSYANWCKRVWIDAKYLNSCKMIRFVLMQNDLKFMITL